MNQKTNQQNHKPKPPPQNQASNQISADKLTLLDYFATHAMEGMVTDVVIDPQRIARMAYELADAMMRERGINREKF